MKAAFRAFAVIITSIAIASSALAAPQRAVRKKNRTVNSVKREQKAVEAEVKKAGRELAVNTRETERSLGRLSVLQRQVADSRAAISASQAGIDSLDRAIASRNDSIARLEARLGRLRDAYASALRRQQLYPDVNSPLAFIFSSSSVADAYRRMRYLRQYDGWRARRTTEIKSAVGQLEEARKRLGAVKASRAEALRRLQSERDRLAGEEAAADRLVADLRKQGEGIRAVLAEKQRRMDALDRELDRLIAEEQARIERERRAAEERRRKEAAERAAREKAEREAKARDKAEAGGKGGKEAGGAQAATPSKPAKPAPAPLDEMAEDDRRLTGSFVANKGRLLFPVAGRYRIVRGFGRQNHPELKHVQTNNNGIDIEVPPGTDARAIFNGTVSAIFRIPGYANVVMVRHGEYISLYANLAGVNVAKGQNVKAGQTIGRVLTSGDDEGGATTFHFELRREKAKLNPLEWVR